MERFLQYAINQKRAPNFFVYKKPFDLKFILQNFYSFKWLGQVTIAGDVALMESKDVYYVVVEPEIDTAFVFGVIAILDNINHQSTAC